MSDLKYVPGPVTAGLSPTPGSSRPPDRDEGDASVYALTLINGVLRERRTVLAIATLTVLATIGYLFATGRVSTRTYTATAAFAPQGRSPAAATGAAGIAAQLGVSVPASDPALSPAFYSELLRSHALLGELVETRYVVPGKSDATGRTLREWYELEDNREAREAAIQRLGGNLTVGTNMRTGIVRVSIRAPDPVLAEAVTLRLLELVNKFNLERRQSQASAERAFTERRLAEVRADLGVAEGRVQEFLWRNREYRSDPTLLFAYDRLAREVSLRQQLVTVLSQAHEQAKIDQVRDTPVITIVEHPYQPVYGDPRGLVRTVLFSGLIGLALGFAAALLRDRMRNGGMNDQPAFAEFASLRREVLKDLLRPTRLVRRSQTAPNG